MNKILLSVLAWLLYTYPAVAEAVDIFAAARAGDVAVIEHHINAGNDINQANDSGFTPFILATYYGHNDAAAALLKAGAKPCAVDDKGSNAYMGVAFKGNADTAAWLLEHTECDINHQNYAGQTALMMAALFDQQDVLQLLLEEGADPAIIDHQGNSAETLAQGQGLTRALDIIKFYLQ